MAVSSKQKSVWTFAQNRQFLPTQELYEVVSKFGNITPAFNNNYDVSFNLSSGSSALKGYISDRSFYKDEKGLADAGQYLALFCSEAVLPGSRLDVFQKQGIRQGINQKFAAYRQFPEIILTWYSQKDYYTNDVFNAWVEFISPTRAFEKGGEFKRMQYPKSYKVPIEITAFSKDTVNQSSRLNRTSKWNQQIPSSITYKLENAFPVNIVAAPLAYGKGELIKTTVTFKYDYYHIGRTSRTGWKLNSSPIGSRLASSTVKYTKTTSKSGGGPTSENAIFPGRETKSLNDIISDGVVTDYEINYEGADDSQFYEFDIGPGPS